MNLVAGQAFYQMPETGRPWGWTLEGVPYQLVEIPQREHYLLYHRHDTQIPPGYPAYWCDFRDGTFAVYPTPACDLELIILQIVMPLPDPAKLAAFVAQEIGA